MESETAVHEVIFKDAKIKDVCSDEGVSFVPDRTDLSSLQLLLNHLSPLKEINKVSKLEL